MAFPILEFPTYTEITKKKKSIIIIIIIIPILAENVDFTQNDSIDGEPISNERLLTPINVY